MTRPLFRPPEFWKSAVMTLPDSSFFELLRSIFGNIKTPFNKQRLMTDLASLLGREEIQKTIAAYIDEGDARVIAAVAVLGEPAPGELESFFAGELSYAALHEILLNLEERFILYRFREDGIKRLALNPVLEPVLAPLAANSSLLFPSVLPEEAAAGQADPAAGRPPADDRLIGGILAFVSEEARFFKAEGGLRKKIADAGAQVFPGFDLESLAGGLRLLGLIRPEGDALVPDGRRISAFAERSPRERMEYWAAGIYCFLYEEEGTGAAAGHLLRGRLRSLADLIHRLADLLRPGRWYPPETLYRYAGLLARRPPESAGKLRPGRLIALLETLGLLASPAPEYRTAGPALTAAEGKTGGQGPFLAMDSPLSCILYPGMAFADILKLAAFLTVREAGVAVRFELTRESAVRGFDRGMSAADMIALLERLSGNRIGENLIWSLRDWEKRYGDVNLRRGLVLTLSEERRYLAEAEPVAALIRETLAPGVYLLESSAADAGPGMEAAAEALRKAGVDIIRRAGPDARPGAGPQGGIFHGSGALFPALESAPEEGPPDRAFPAVPPELGAGAEALKERFRGALKNMSLSKEERDELNARINRRLVLNESQLEGASVRYEKLEARLLDYVGKAAIAKQAVSSKSPVEVSWPHPQKGSVRVTGIPEALEKTGGESILILKPLSPENEETLRIPLGKISLLRRIKKSIFGD
jgi:hypothetical protein